MGALNKFLLNYRYFKEIYFSFFLLVAIIFIGTMGFMIVEDYNLIEAFYMSIITLSTVGFQEVKPLSEMGKLFTSFLIITTFGTFAYAITSITRSLVTGEYKYYFKDFKVTNEIENLSGHTIVCGYGRNGRQALKTLQAHGKKVVIIEQNEETIEEIKLNASLLYVKGDSTKEDALFDAGIERAEALITTLPKDSDNVFVVLTSRELNKNLTIISRASEDSSERKMRIAGANNVIMPDKVGGAHMGSLVVTPDVIEFLDHISVMGANEINLEEIEFKEFPSDFHYKTIKDLEQKYQTGARIIGFKTPEGEYIVNPSPEIELMPNSKVFVLGTSKQISKLYSVFSLK